MKIHISTSTTQMLLQAIATVLLSFSICTLAYGGTLTSFVNRNSMGLSETLSLTITYNEKVNSNQLNYQVLNQNFDILDVAPQSSSSISIINGKTTEKASTVWSLTLAAKKPGKLTIPAFAINGDTSQPVIIDVNNKGTASTKPLQVFVSTNKQSIHPSEQLVLEVELSAQSGIGNLNGTALQIEGAEIELLGQQNFQRADNGIIRQIVILRYAIYVKNEGQDKTTELLIPAMSFTGTKGRQRSGFDPFAQRAEQVIARSNSLSIEVKPLIKKSNNPWFPAKEVSIASSWSADKTKLTVGQPITRTITITAHDQKASVIPPLNNPPAIDYKRYVDKAQLESKKTEAGYISTRIESEAIVPSSSGTITLPALTVNWFNTNTQQWQEEILPAETLTVAASAIDVSSSGTTTNLSSQPNELAQERASTPSNEGKAIGLWTLASCFLAIICLLQFCMILKLWRTAKKEPNNIIKLSSSNLVGTNEPKAWKQLQQTLKTDDVPEIRKAILNWANYILPKTKQRSLRVLANHSQDSALNVQLNQQFTTLDECIYKAWNDLDKESLSNVLTLLKQNVSQRKPKKGVHKSLKPLYPKSSS